MKNWLFVQKGNEESNKVVCYAWNKILKIKINSTLLLNKMYACMDGCDLLMKTKAMKGNRYEAFYQNGELNCFNVTSK